LSAGMLCGTSDSVRLTGSQVLTTILAVLILWLVVSVIFSTDGLTHLAGMHTERGRVAEVTLTLMARNQELEATIRRIHADDDYLERIARLELGLVAPDEMIYRFRDDAKRRD